MNALKEGVITSISVEADADSVKVTMERNAKDDTRTISIPAGLTTFGFANSGKIKIGGTGFSAIATPEATTLELASYVQTDDFSGEGFSLDFPKAEVVVLPKDKRSVEIKSGAK